MLGQPRANDGGKQLLKSKTRQNHDDIKERNQTNASQRTREVRSHEGQRS